MAELDVRQEDGYLSLVLNRPEKLNALRLADLELLSDIFTDTRGADVVVIRGAGERAFCTGIDVDELVTLRGPEEAREFISVLRRVFARIRRAPVTTICAIDGLCIGVGMELAVACDLRLVTTRTRFGLPEVKLGIPTVIDGALLPQYVGLGHAKEMILTGGLYSASDPRMTGLCNRIVEPLELEKSVRELVDEVSGHTKTVLAAQKRLFDIWQNMPLEAGIDASLTEFAAVFAAEETRAVLARHHRGLGSGMK